MQVLVLSSGSSGNCAYVETDHAKILIDAGIPYKDIVSRMAKEGKSVKELDAVFVTHEHTDHIRSLVNVLKDSKATLFINKTTYSDAEEKLKKSLAGFNTHYIKSNIKYNVGDLSVVPLKLSHDTSYCYGFVLKQGESGNITYGQITDTGYLPEEYFKLLSFVKVLLFESNHDVDMLMTSSRPDFLKKRIKSNKGHLSNDQCLEYLKKFTSENNKHIILGHISEECNEYMLAKENIEKGFNGKVPFKLTIAYQNTPLPIMNIEDE